MANLTARRRQRLRLTQLRQRYDGTPLVPQEWCRPPVQPDPRHGTYQLVRGVRGERASRVWLDEIAGFDPQPELTAENERAAEAVRNGSPAWYRHTFTKASFQLDESAMADGRGGFTFAGSGIGLGGMRVAIDAAAARQMAEARAALPEPAFDLMGEIMQRWVRTFTGPRPMGRIDFDSLVAPRLTEALDLLHEARADLASARRHLADAGRFALEAVETLVGR